MKIKTNSWHYKLHDIMSWEIPDNLCGYFWKTILAMLITLVLGPIFAIIAPFVLGFMWAADKLSYANEVIRRKEKEALKQERVPFTLKAKRSLATYDSYYAASLALFAFAGFFTFFFSLPPDSLTPWGHVGLSALCSVLLTGLTVGLPIGCWVQRDGGYPWRRFKKEYKQRREDDLVGSYFKAVKGRFCPLIEFERE